MATRKKKPRPSGKVKSQSPVATSPAETKATGRREVRPYIYAGFDLLMVVIWAIVLSTALSNRHGWASLLMWSMVFFALVMGVAMLFRNKWGWRSAALGCAAILVLWLVIVVALLMSAAYLAGVYGAFGRGAAMAALVFAVLTVQVVALIPALQLKFLLTRAGRRHFNLEPLWR